MGEDSGVSVTVMQVLQIKSSAYRCLMFGPFVCIGYCVCKASRLSVLNVRSRFDLSCIIIELNDVVVC